MIQLKNNVIKVKTTIILAVASVLVSCQNHDLNTAVSEIKYRIEYLNGNDSSDDSRNLIQLYIAGKDTLVNQTLNKKNGHINYSKSSYYKLDIKNTQNSGIYSAELMLHSNLKNIQNVEFEFLEKKSGKKVISKINSPVGKTINFKFSNPDSNQLVGILKFAGEVEEKNGNEINLYPANEYILVDNLKGTDNLFLEKYNLLDKMRLNN